MIISHEEESKVVVSVIDKTVCNCCGKEIVDEEYIHINQSFGYWSNHDGEIHNMDICQECYEKFISTFKIPVEITEYM
jgi:ribosomal-protein-alanine N-acetyltransferase